MTPGATSPAPAQVVKRAPPMPLRQGAGAAAIGANSKLSSTSHVTLPPKSMVPRLTSLSGPMISPPRPESAESTQRRQPGEGEVSASQLRPPPVTIPKAAPVKAPELKDEAGKPGGQLISPIKFNPPPTLTGPNLSLFPQKLSPLAAAKPEAPEPPTAEAAAAKAAGWKRLEPGELNAPGNLQSMEVFARSQRILGKINTAPPAAKPRGSGVLADGRTLLPRPVKLPSAQPEAPKEIVHAPPPAPEPPPLDQGATGPMAVPPLLEKSDAPLVDKFPRPHSSGPMEPQPEAPAAREVETPMRETPAEPVVEEAPPLISTRPQEMSPELPLFTGPVAPLLEKAAPPVVVEPTPASVIEAKVLPPLVPPASLTPSLVPTAVETPAPEPEKDAEVLKAPATMPPVLPPLPGVGVLEEPVVAPVVIEAKVAEPVKADALPKAVEAPKLPEIAQTPELPKTPEVAKPGGDSQPLDLSTIDVGLILAEAKAAETKAPEPAKPLGKLPPPLPFVAPVPAPGDKPVTPPASPDAPSVPPVLPVTEKAPEPAVAPDKPPVVEEKSAPALSDAERLSMLRSRPSLEPEPKPATDKPEIVPPVLDKASTDKHALEKAAEVALPVVAAAAALTLDEKPKIKDSAVDDPAKLTPVPPPAHGAVEPPMQKTGKPVSAPPPKVEKAEKVESAPLQVVGKPKSKPGKEPLPFVPLASKKPPIPLTRAERARRRRIVELVIFYCVIVPIAGVLLYLGTAYVSNETRVEGQVIPPDGMTLNNEVYIVNDFRDLASGVAEDLARERAPLEQEIQEREEHVQRAEADVASREERIRLIQEQIAADKDEIDGIVKQARDATQQIWNGPGAEIDADYTARMNQLQEAIAARAKSLKLPYQPDPEYNSPEVWANAYRLALYDCPAGIDSVKEHDWLSDQMKQWRDFEKSLDDRKEKLREKAAEIKVAPAPKIADINDKIDDLQQRIDSTTAEEVPLKAELDQARADLVSAQAADAGLDDKYYKQLYVLPGEAAATHIPLATNGRFSWTVEDKVFGSGVTEHRYWIFACATRTDGRQSWMLGHFNIERSHKMGFMIEPKDFISTKAILRPNLSPDEQAQ